MAFLILELSSIVTARETNFEMSAVFASADITGVIIFFIFGAEITSELIPIVDQLMLVGALNLMCVVASETQIVVTYWHHFTDPVVFTPQHPTVVTRVDFLPQLLIVIRNESLFAAEVNVLAVGRIIKIVLPTLNANINVTDVTAQKH